MEVSDLIKFFGGMKSMPRWSWKPADETTGALAHMSIVEHFKKAMRQLRSAEGV